MSEQLSELILSQPSLLPTQVVEDEADEADEMITFLLPVHLQGYFVKAGYIYVEVE